MFTDVPLITLDSTHKSRATNLYRKLHDSVQTRCNAITASLPSSPRSLRLDFELLARTLSECSDNAPYLFGSEAGELPLEFRAILQNEIDTVQTYLQDDHAIRSWLGEDLSDLIDVVLTRVSILNGLKTTDASRGWSMSELNDILRIAPALAEECLLGVKQPVELEVNRLVAQYLESLVDTIIRTETPTRLALPGNEDDATSRLTALCDGLKSEKSLGGQLDLIRHHNFLGTSRAPLTDLGRKMRCFKRDR